jgi:glycosyltransferase involved in cell wall biosynthesis
MERTVVAISTYVAKPHRTENVIKTLDALMLNKLESTIVIMVDDGSTLKKHIEYARKYPSVIIVEKAKNSGISKCKNTCIRVALENSSSDDDVVMLLDDDVIVEKGFEDAIHNGLTEGSILSGFCNFERHPKKVVGKYTAETHHLNGFCLSMTRNTLQMAGYFLVFPEKYGHEHTWFTYRVMRVTGQTKWIDIIENDIIYVIRAESSVDRVYKQLEVNNAFLHDEACPTDGQACIE